MSVTAFQCAFSYAVSEVQHFLTNVFLLVNIIFLFSLINCCLWLNIAQFENYATHNQFNTDSKNNLYVILWYDTPFSSPVSLISYVIKPFDSCPLCYSIKLEVLLCIYN